MFIDGLLNIGGVYYEGDIAENRPEGRGICSWSDGNKYDGEWKQGKMHGFGIHTW